MTSTRIKQTFDELGINGFRPLRNLLLVRTNPMPEKTGSLFLPPKMSTLYGSLRGDSQLVTAEVLAAGPKATVLPGEQIVFIRLHYAWWKFLSDKTSVGWIQEANVWGQAELEEGDTYADLIVMVPTLKPDSVAEPLPPQMVQP